MKIPQLTDVASYREAETRLQQLKLRRNEQAARVQEMQRQKSTSQDREAEVEAVLAGGSIATATITRDDIAQAGVNYRAKAKVRALPSAEICPTHPEVACDRKSD